ncbi:MAG: TolC family protein [Desulfobacterales bacterium]|nr:TolC family protein [Desulfobacterales bacterium]
MPTLKKPKKTCLKDAIVHALKNNPDLQIRMVTADKARKDVTINKSIFIPQLQFDFDAQKPICLKTRQQALS